MLIRRECDKSRSGLNHWNELWEIVVKRLDIVREVDVRPDFWNTFLKNIRFLKRGWNFCPSLVFMPKKAAGEGTKPFPAAFSNFIANSPIRRLRIWLSFLVYPHHSPVQSWRSKREVERRRCSPAARDTLLPASPAIGPPVFGNFRWQYG